MNAVMINRWQASAFPALALCIAVLLHGAFSSPAPKAMGVAEILIALCLLIAMLPRLPQLLDARQLTAAPQRLAWLWLLIVPLGIALLSGHDMRDTSRDLIAICFLGLPALIGGIDKKYLQTFALAIAICGASMALRYWLMTNGFAALRNLKDGDGLLYLALDPTMLFAAIYFPVQLIETWLSKNKNISKIFIAAFSLFAAILCWGALSGMMMRGALALGIISLSLYALRFRHKPIVPIFMGIIAVGVIIIFYEPIARTVHDLWLKTQAVGLNARDAEFAAIWKIQAENPFAFLFGQGWGATYSSPAVGGYWVNYSHSAFGFYFLKTGVIGLGILAFYLLRIALPLRTSAANVPLLFATLPPLILSFTLYTSYKFFGCGILLLLLGSLNAHSHPQPR